MADAGSEFARELLRRRVERLKPVKKVEIEKPKEKPEIRSDEEIVRDPSSSWDDFHKAANRLEGIK